MALRKDPMNCTDYTLYAGSHGPREGKRCAMEWVAYLVGGGHTDHPECVHGFLRSFCIALNDTASDDERQRLRPYLSRTIGTVDDGVDRPLIASKFLGKEVQPLHGYFAGMDAYHEYGMDFALELLDALLPTVASEALDRLQDAAEAY